MSNCKAVEPAPTRFYAPASLFSEADLQRLGAEWLGDTIKSPGGCFSYRVASGPLCRIHHGNRKPEPHSFESSYQQDERGRWKRSHPNYLSYLIEKGSFITVRWQSPLRESAAGQSTAPQKLAA